MVSWQNVRQHLPRVLILLIILSLALAACERPLQDTGADTTDEDAPIVDEIEVEDLSENDIDSETGEVIDEGEEAAVDEEDAVTAPEGDADTVPEEEEIVDEEPAEVVEQPADSGAEETAGEGDEEVIDAGQDGDTESPRPVDETPSEETTAEENAAEETTAEETTTDETAEETVAEETAAEEETTAAEETTAEAETTTEEETAAEADATLGGQAGTVTHVVQPGENLYRIGLQYNVSWVVLARYNNIQTPSSIYPGMTLQIPSDSNVGGEVPTPTPAPSTPVTYQVKPGDTLYSIGRTFNVPWTEIAEANNIVNPNRIEVGQVLTIPYAGDGSNPGNISHNVQPGETLFLISLNYGIPWTTIATANSLAAPYVIYPGQVLVIPGN